MSDSTQTDTTAPSSYDDITSNWIWLEDAWRGKYSRYLRADCVKDEDDTSVWLCHDCHCVDADPYEGECDCEN